MNNGYIARLDARALSADACVSKAVKDEGAYVTLASSAEEIKARAYGRMNSWHPGIPGWDLFDGSCAYMVVQESAAPMDLMLNYQDLLLTVKTDAGTRAVFDPEGYVAVEGEKAFFRLGITANRDYPMRWFTLRVEGTAEKASLRMTSEGYILAMGEPGEITISANNKKEKVSRTFSSPAGSVFICETEEGELAVMEEHF